MEFSKEQYEEYLSKGYKRNFAVNIADAGFFWFAVGLSSREVIIPALLLKLGASNMILSFVPTLMLLGFTLPQLLVTHRVEGMPRVLPYLKMTGIFQRLPWFILVFLLPILAGKHDTLLIYIFILLLGISWFAGGMSMPAWGELLAKSIPKHRLGALFGYMGILGHTFTLLSGFLVKIIMDHPAIPYPENYTIIFASTAVILVISYLFFIQNREPLSRHPDEYVSKPFKEHFRGLGVLLKQNRQLKKIIISRILSQSNLITTAFLLVFAVRVCKCGDSDIGNFVLVSTVGAVLTSLIFGKINEWVGPRWVLILSSVFCVISVALVLISQMMLALLLAFVFMAMNKGSQQIGQQVLVLQYADEKSRPTWLGITATFSAPFLIIYSLVASYLVDNYGFTIPFGLVIVCNLLAVVFLLSLKKPGHDEELQTTELSEK